MENKYLFLFFELQVFIAIQGVGTHYKKLSKNKLPLHQHFIVFRQFHCINVRRIKNCIFFCDVSLAVRYIIFNTFKFGRIKYNMSYAREPLDSDCYHDKHFISFTFTDIFETSFQMVYCQFKVESKT